MKLLSSGRDGDSCTKIQNDDLALAVTIAVCAPSHSFAKKGQVMSAVMQEMELHSPPPKSKEAPAILVVDDSRAGRAHAANVIRCRCGHSVRTAENGGQALELCEKEAPSLIVTDLDMPEMDGLQLVQEVKGRWPSLPIILMTAKGTEELAMQALREGAASYVAKRHMERDLPEILDQVLAAARVDRRKQALLGKLDERSSHFVLDNDPADIPALVAIFQNELSAMGLCTAASRIRIGVALEEALLNGLIHGNLEVSSELRTAAVDSFERQIAQRRRLSPYQERRLQVFAKLSKAEAVFTVRDEGPGFDLAKLPDPTDPENLERPSGRGILLIRTFMDEVIYNDKGNEVRMVKRIAPAGNGVHF
ncbi:MAG TPA: response regulator [Gemmataceae bacterium]|nr:response regulator [Gemmataceae bacterium]